MTTFRKSFQLFSVAAALATLVASPAFAHISSNNERGGRAISTLIAPFHGFQQNTASKKIEPAVEEAGEIKIRIAEAALVREANTVDTLDQYNTARSENS